MTLLETERTTWVGVCLLGDLTVGRGVAALVHGRAVALFRLDEAGTVRAVDNIDPCTGASVLSRGLIGQTGTTTYVASPLRKQRFDLDTGAGLDGDQVIATWAVRVSGGVVEVGSEGSSSSNGPETTP